MVRVVGITLIRHGMTIKNREKRYQGWTDAPILPEEKVRLSECSQHFPKPDTVISSDLKRCTETAAHLFPHKRIHLDERLRELHFGDFEDKTYEQLKDCGAYRNWVDQAFRPAPPNGETFQTFTTRIQKGWDDAITLFEDDNINEVALVTHAGVIRFFLEKYAPVKKSYWEWVIKNGRGYRLTATIDQLRRGKRCISCSEVPLTGNPNG